MTSARNKGRKKTTMTTDDFDLMKKDCSAFLREYPKADITHHLRNPPIIISAESAKKLGKAIEDMQIGPIIFDEYGEWIEPKWYKNPINWWRYRRMLRKMRKHQQNDDYNQFGG